MLKRAATLALAAMMLACAALAADNRKEFRYTVGPGCSVSIINVSGPIVVQPAKGRFVIVTATTHSDKVEVDDSHHGNRVEVRSHVLQRGSESEARVDYEVQTPPDAVVTIRSGDGPLRVTGLQGDLTAQGESAPVELRDLTNAHVQVRTVNGSITLQNVTNSYVDVTTVGGGVSLTGVSGPKVAVNTSNGAIRYSGDFGANGNYVFMSHSGGIDVSLPASASVDIVARSVNGAVQNDFPFQPNQHSAVAPIQGRSFTGLANSGASSVRLSSFSGTITVKKQ